MIKLDGSTIVARTLTEQEIEFMYLLFKEAADYGYADMIRYELKSNKSITFFKRTEYLGRVKLNGRKMYVGKIEGGTLDVSNAQEAFQHFSISKNK